jgi:adenylosuccinate lyase
MEQEEFNRIRAANEGSVQPDRTIKKLCEEIVALQELNEYRLHKIDREHECAEELKEGLKKQYADFAKEMDDKDEEVRKFNLQIEAMRPVVNAARDYADAFHMTGCNGYEINDTAKGLRIKQAMARALEKLDEFISGKTEKREDEVLVYRLERCERCGREHKLAGVACPCMYA